MATIILNSAASNTSTGTTELIPQDGDIYILKSDAIAEFKFLGDADFEVRIEDAGPYAQDSGIFGPVTLSFEDTTNPTVNYANGVDAERVQLNANGDSLTVNAGDNVTLGPIIGSGEEIYSSMPSGDGLNADGGGLTVNTGSGTTVTSQIVGPSSGADANYTFGEGGEFWSNATVTGSVGGNTTIVVGDNAVVSPGAGFVAPSGELNGDTQSITIGNNAGPNPNFPSAWEVTVAGTDGEKTIDLGDDVTVAEVGFGTEGYEQLIDFDNTTTYVNPTGGTLTAGENLTVRTPVWGTEEGSTYIIGDGWDVPFDLRGAGENNGDDPEAQLILGAPKSDDGTTIEVMGSGNDLISIMPPEAPADERSNLIGSLIQQGWAENDDGSYSPTALTDPANSYLIGPGNESADIQISGFSGPALGAAAPNQIVDGENNAEFMGDGYDDSDGATDSGGDIIDGADGDNDVILGNGGNDNINAGAGTDEVYGGSGNDVIDGGAGNDTLTGDFASDVTDTVVDNSTVEGDDILEGGAGNDVIYGDSGNSLSAGGEGVLGTTLGDGPGSTGGGYDRISAQSVSNGNHSFSTDAFYLGNDIPVLDDANRNAITGVSFSQDGEGTDRTFGLDELEFTGAQRSFVGLVTVQDSDVHNANDQFSSSISGGFQDTTVVSSGTADFTMNDGEVFEGIRVNFVRGPDGETYMMPDDGPSPFAQNAFKAMLFNNSSGIKSFTIATGSGDDAGINPIEGNWADGQFFELTEGDGGDDTIIGGEGADQMFGEGGDDTFVVGSAADGAGDVISGGFGPDQNTDNDVLDLTGAGPVTINATADANDAGAQSGTVTFADGSTLTFEGIETIIQDPDNTAPVIDPIAPQTTPENSTAPVFTPTATDPDGDPVTYSLTGDDADLFNIDPTTGEVTPIAPLDFENPTDANGDGIYDVTVVATDPDGLTDEEPVAITVDDVNEAPVLEDIGPPTAPENSTDPVFTATATDPDGDQPVYSLTGPDADLFNIDPTTGVVTPVAPLDADNPTDANGDGIYDVTVVATDPNDPTLSDEEDVSITVGDVNEAPVIDPIDDTSIDENSTAPVFTPTATDPDGDPVTYSLTGDDADLFNIDPTTGEVTPIAPLDFENPTDANGDGIYDVTVVATDPDGLTDEEPVAITVDDVNEAPVLEDIGPPTAPENSTDPVFTATATDPDGDQPVYSLTGPDADLFNIDPTTGVVTPVAPLDADNPTDANGDGIYDVTVVATDPNDPTLSDEEDVSITVGDVNEAPVIDPIDDTSIDENSTAPVFTPTATDPDGDPVTYSLTGDDADLFNIDPTTGEVTPIAPLDFENPTDANGDGIYDVTVVATDPDGLTDEEPVAITVDDVNEAPKAIDDRAETDFNTPVTIDVLDNDTDAEGDTLTIINPTVPANQGTVSVVNGELLFTPADGFEGDATISYTVSDGDLTDTAEVVVTVGDNPADGVVDGAETGETMLPDDYIDPQGDAVDGADGPNDSILGNGGDDIIDGGAGNDTIDGGADNDSITGGVGDDSIAGGDGTDTLVGGDGNDTLDGGAGDDDIAVGGGDVASGGTGDDVFTVDPTDTAPEVDVTLDGGADGTDGSPDDNANGNEGDVLDLSDQTDDLDVTFGTNPEDGTVDGLDATVGDTDITFSEIEAVNTGSGDDIIDGTAATGPIDVDAGEGNDTVDGGDGDDTIAGGEGSDTLAGGEGADLIDGGADDDDIIAGAGDTALGGSGDDVFTVDPTLTGTDPITVVGGETGEDLTDPTNGGDGDVLDLSGSGPVEIVYDTNDPTYDPVTGVGESGTATYTNAAGDPVTINFSEIETVIPCFTPGTLIATAKGERLVEELQPGDRIITRDNGFQEIAWVGQKQLAAHEMRGKTDLRPIFVKAGSLGGGLPERDMMLSPNHKVLLADDQAELYFEEREVLVAAKHLVGKAGIHQVDVAHTTYIHFMFERHEVVLSGGTWTESFHPGDFAINGIDEEARAEILALFPELATDQGLRDYRLARTELKKHEARLLIG